MSNENTSITNRKNDHVMFAMSEMPDLNIEPGFQKYRFEHNALPEMDFADIDTSIKFLGRKLNIPMMISSITGGTEKAEKINRALSDIANDFKIGFAVGSQRIALENSSLKKFFNIRHYAPNILLFANFGAVQLNYGYSIDECRRAVEMVDADALILHLNPLHEVFQTDRNTNFIGLLKKIEDICSKLDAPVIVKEVGYGISVSVAKKLKEAGVFAVEIAGAGSVSWTEIEKKRSNDIVLKNAANAFRGWGNPTTDCIASIAEKVHGLKIIASGGVKNGVDIAKSIALGADFCGNASEFLKRAIESRAECENFMESLTLELKAAMFCTGARNIQELKSAKLLHV